MIINSYLDTLHGQRELNRAARDLGTLAQRLSSGMKVVNVSDNPVGKAISDTMTSQIRGLSQAARNLKDASSLIQTAEFSIIQITSNLQRMRELAIQASSGANTFNDRVSIQKEIVQLKIEINSIAVNTRFNGKNLLDGSFKSGSFQAGISLGETSSISIDNVNPDAVGNSRYIFDGLDIRSAIRPSKIGAMVSSDQRLLISGKNNMPIAVGIEKNLTMAELSDRVNSVSDKTSVHAKARNDVLLSDFTPDRTYTVSLNPSDSADTFITFVVGKDGNLSDAIAQINGRSSSIRASIDPNNRERLILSNNEGKDILIRSISALTSSGEKVSLSDKTAFDAAKKLAEDAGDAVATIKGTAPADLIELDKRIAAYTDAVSKLAKTTPSSFKVTQIRSFQRVDGFVGVDNFKTSSSEIGNLQGNPVTLGFLDGEEQSVRMFGSIELHSDSSFVFEIKAPDGNPLGKDLNTLLGLSGERGMMRESELNSVDNLDVSTIRGADDAIKVVDAALSKMNLVRSELGSAQNQLARSISDIRVSVETVTFSRSRIRDADFAKEIANLSAVEIRRQTGMSILAQTNELRREVLKLIQN